MQQLTYVEPGRVEWEEAEAPAVNAPEALLGYTSKLVVTRD